MAPLRNYPLLWALALVTCFSCRKQAPRPFKQPPAAAVKTQPQPASTIPDPPSPEASTVRKPSDLTLESSPMQVPPPPPHPKKSSRRPKAPSPVIPAAVAPAPISAPVTTPEEVEPAPKPPHLGILLSADDQQRLNLEIDQDLKRTGEILITLSSKRLSSAQLEVVAQIRSFVTQAETLRKTDLQSAGGIAHKATVLAADLDTRLR